LPFARRNEAINHFRDHEEVVLWFKHDLYDQLQLIQILDWSSPGSSANPDIADLRGFVPGPMPPEQLVHFTDTGHTVTAAEFTTTQAA